MNLVPWRNKREESMDTGLARMREEMDSLFERWMGGGRGFFEPLGELFRSGIGPRVELSESDKEVTLKAELPGVRPDDVEINIEGNMLVLRGEKKHEKEERKRDYHYVERQYGSFHRAIPLPSTIDPNKVEATFKDGVLTVSVAKRPEAQPKRITVKAG